MTITRPTPAPAAPAWLVELAPRIMIVVCDLDDTLLDACHQVPARTAQVVRRLHRCGVRFSPATGRTVPALRGLFGSLSDEIDFVAGNGTDVSVDGCTIYHAPYPRAAALELFDAVKGSRQRLGFVTFDETGPHLASVEADFVRAHVESLRHAPVCPDELLFAGRELGKVGVVAPQGAAAGVEELEQAVGDLFSFAPTGPYWIDVLVRGIDKAQGIDRMLVHLGNRPLGSLGVRRLHERRGHDGAAPQHRGRLERHAGAQAAVRPRNRQQPRRGSARLPRPALRAAGTTAVSGPL